jgi:hypothetical protein
MAGADATGRAFADWQLAPVPARVRIWLFALAFVHPVLLVVVTLATVAGIDVPGNVPEGSPATPWLAPVGGVAFVSGALWFALDLALRRHRITLGDEGLRVASTFYTRTFRLDELRLEQARQVVLAERPEYAPALKTNGFALPGFASGWFRLRNGERALVATAGGRRVAWLPTTRGHGLLLEPRRPQALLDRLHALADGQRRR